MQRDASGNHRRRSRYGVAGRYLARWSNLLRLHEWSVFARGRLGRCMYDSGHMVLSAVVHCGFSDGPYSLPVKLFNVVAIMVFMGLCILAANSAAHFSRGQFQTETLPLVEAH